MHIKSISTNTNNPKNRLANPKTGTQVNTTSNKQILKYRARKPKNTEKNHIKLSDESTRPPVSYTFRRNRLTSQTEKWKFVCPEADEIYFEQTTLPPPLPPNLPSDVKEASKIKFAFDRIGCKIPAGVNSGLRAMCFIYTKVTGSFVNPLNASRFSSFLPLWTQGEPEVPQMHEKHSLSLPVPFPICAIR